MEDHINNKKNPDEESWDNIPEGEDIPERIEWLEEIDGGELDDHCLFCLFVYPGYPV